MPVSKRKRILTGLGIVLFTLILGYAAIRPFHLRWGATDEEVSMSMPGTLGGRSWTRAITVNAPPEDIWPWLVQWGQGRGGWYSYDWLENLLGFNIHTADRILPEYQDPVVGDPICMAENVCNNLISVIDPQQWFGWQASDPGGKPEWTFMLGLIPVNESSTRFIIRESFAPDAMPAAVISIIEIPDVVMELKALDTIKQRAEGILPSPWITVYEIIVWLAAFAMGIIAAVWTMQSIEWKKPLTVGVLSVVVLLVLTFLYPPLWVRAMLDVGLLGALIYAKPR